MFPRRLSTLPAVSLILDIYPGSGFFHPGSRVRKDPILGTCSANLMISHLQVGATIVISSGAGSDFFVSKVSLFFLFQKYTRSLQPDLRLHLGVVWGGMSGNVYNPMKTLNTNDFDMLWVIPYVRS
jgi:hypothetical protein